MKLLKLFVLFTAGLSTVINAQNTSLLFDGTGTKIVVNDNDNFDIGSAFTIEAWINASNWKPESWAGTIVAKDNTGPDAGFAFRAGKDGSLSFVMSVNESWVEAVSSPIMEANVWNHVAAVVNNGLIKLYINANEVASASFTGTPTSNTVDLTIGESAGFPGRVFDGRLDEIRIWNVGRSKNEISDNYTTELKGDETGLVAYYNLNEGDGITISNLVQATTDTNGSLDGFTGSNYWVSGFELPQNDVGIKALTAPDIITAFSRPTKIKVSIQNFGFNEVTNIPVGYSVAGGPAVEENVAITLAPGETYEHTFTEILNITGSNQSIVNVFTDFEEDTNDLNDEISVVFNQPSGANANKILALDKIQHNFGTAGQTQFSSVLFPQDLSDYNQINMHVKVECPSGGCDPWDQPAKIAVIKDGNEYEIGRFITPFGIGTCGPWIIDVTDFKTLLQGAVEVKSFIQVWGPSGWLLSVEFELIEGSEPASFQKLSSLWKTDYHVYGDPGISDDLEPMTVSIASTTQNSHIRMTVTGHGQGNTDNAAEFSNKTHSLHVNGTKLADHHLWKADCNTNNCSPQNGTWEFNRAGWCPGQAVNPFVMDLTNQVQPGEDLTIDYELETYVNLLNTGYNSGSHTEPHYRIWSYLIEESSERYESFINLSLSALQLASDTVNEEVSFGPLTMTIHNTGNKVVSNPSVQYYNNGILISTEMVTTTIEPGQSTNYEFSTLADFQKDNDYELVAVVNLSEDQNSNDDAIGLKLISEATITAIGNDLKRRINIFPNPSRHGTINVKGLETNKVYVIKLFDLNGRLTGYWKVTNQDATLLNIGNSNNSILTILEDGSNRYSFQLLRE